MRDRVEGCYRGACLAGILLTAAMIGRASAGTLTLPLLEQTIHDRLVLHRTSYNYAPAIIHDGPLYRLYWCAGIAGDYILTAHSTDPSGPWEPVKGWFSASFDVALKPTGAATDFDGLHTCDPNILKIGTTYYLYYTGLAKADALSAIGVASSSDGVHFQRLGGGTPIVTASETNTAYRAQHLTYGAGQPAAVSIAPYVYLSFTDSTGAGTNRGNGSGQFLLRSRDPTFRDGNEELTASGWQARPPGVHTAEFSYLESFGLDLAYDPVTKLILAATDRVSGQATLYAFEPDRMMQRGTGTLDLDWREGPAIVSEADKSLPERAACDKVDIGILAATGPSSDPFSWHDLAYSEGVFSMKALCDGIKR